MKDKIVKGIYKYQVILKNTGWLSLIKIAQLIMPFVALPYIIGTVGSDNYGQVVFIQAIVNYFILFINFGLDITAVKDISLSRHSRKALSYIVSSIISVKIVLLLISTLIFTISIFAIPALSGFKLLAFFAFLTCVGEVIFPTWFYQGIEKMKYLTYIRFIAIIFYTCSVFLVIHTENDYVYIALLQSLTSMVSGFASLFFMVKLEKIKFVIPKKKRMLLDFKNSIPFFLSSVSASASSGISKLVCGAFFSMHLVAAFDIAQKISMLAITPMQMLNQAVYPHISKTRDKIFANRFLWINISLSAFIALFMFLFAPLLVSIISSNQIDEAVTILRVLSMYTFFGGIATYIGAPVLISFGYPKPFTNSVIISFIALIMMYLIMFITNYYNTFIYFAFILVLAELIIVIYRMYYCFTYQIFTLPWKTKKS